MKKQRSTFVSGLIVTFFMLSLFGMGYGLLLLGSGLMLIGPHAVGAAAIHIVGAISTFFLGWGTERHYRWAWWGGFAFSIVLIVLSTLMAWEIYQRTRVSGELVFPVFLALVCVGIVLALLHKDVREWFTPLCTNKMHNANH
jgi:hypothetical protein